MKKVAVGSRYMSQQDDAPAHTSDLVQQYLSENVDTFWPKHLWPPNSPDLNHLDYYVWGVCERDTNKVRLPNIESLKKAIQAKFRNMKGNELKGACLHFRQRLEAAVKAEGGYIE
jgi:hypothetical protein